MSRTPETIANDLWLFWEYLAFTRTDRGNLITFRSRRDPDLLALLEYCDSRPSVTFVRESITRQVLAQ